MKPLAMAVLVCLMCSSSALATPITYYVNETIGSGSVVGTVKTDGTMGVLSTANILDWTLTLSSPNLAGGSPDTIMKSSGADGVGGSALTATASELIFNFGLAGSYFFMGGSDFNGWCMSSGPLSCTSEAPPSEVIVYSTDHFNPAEVIHPSGRETIGVVSEPATLALLGLGLTAILVFSRRRTG